MTYLLSIDQGTTSTRAIVFSESGSFCGQHQIELKQYFPNDAWVEHDATEIVSATQTVCREAIKAAGIAPTQLAGVGITNQRETVVLWDRQTGKPLYRAIVWQDRRTAERCVQLQADGAEPLVQQRTGLLLDPYFSGTKIAWLLDQLDPDRQQAASGRWAVGTIDSYLVWCLTGGNTHITDATNASRTLLFNIHTQQWDTELLRLFNIPQALLPEVSDCAGQLAMTSADILGATVPISGMAGDQHAALVGQACFQPGMIKSTYGTGCFMMLNTGEQPVVSDHRLLTTLAYRLQGEVSYALEGSIFVAGAAVQWLRDGLRILSSAQESEAIAKAGNVMQNVYLVPAFAGLGAPYWDPDARGAIVGLTRGSSAEDIVIAALESVAFQSRDLILAMQADMAKQAAGKIVSVRVDGGMVANEWVLQNLADILRVPVDRPKVIETTALGAAYLAGLGVEVLPGLTEINQHWQLDKRVEAQMRQEDSDRLYQGWLQAVNRVRS